MTLWQNSICKKLEIQNAFTLQVREYDLLDQVTEEHTEDQKGIILLKNVVTHMTLMASWPGHWVSS